MSRQIDFEKTLSEDEVKYLQERDDSRLAGAKLPGDAEVDVNPDVRGTPDEPGLDYVPADEDEQEQGEAAPGPQAPARKSTKKA